MQGDGGSIRFPCTRLPEDDRAARLIGLYPQRQVGLWMQRVKVPSGRLSAVQWRALTAIAQRFTPATPLHLTTRQDVELHDLTAEAIPAVQAAIAAAGLSTVGACGDTLRNITVCSCSGLRAGSIDLHDLAESMRTLVQSMEGAASLPRKFKIALSCSPTCGQPWINDLAFVARRRDARWGFQVIGAGSLGARPATGIELFDWIAADQVLPLVWAAVTLFAAHGDRSNRARARLRHVRQRMGDDAFRALVGQFHAQARRDWRDVRLAPSDDGFGASAVLTFVNGDISVGSAEALAELAEADDLAVRIGNQHRVVVFGRSANDLARRLAAQPALASAARAQPAIVACPGRTWCKRGLTDTRGLALRLARDWAGLSPNATVAISGCPNGCAQSAVADIGLIGRLASHGGKAEEAYDLLVGGGMGRDDRLAMPIATGLAPADIPANPPAV